MTCDATLFLPDWEHHSTSKALRPTYLSQKRACESRGSAASAMNTLKEDGPFNNKASWSTTPEKKGLKSIFQMA